MSAQVTKKDILVAARGLIENKGWTQYAFARDAGNEPRGTTDPRASCFCTLGAVYRAADDLNADDLAPRAILRHLAVQSGYGGIPSFNDDPMTTKADVLSLFDRAIELAQAGEAAVEKEGAR